MELTSISPVVTCETILQVTSVAALIVILLILQLPLVFGKNDDNIILIKEIIHSEAFTKGKKWLLYDLKKNKYFKYSTIYGNVSGIVKIEG